jgi:hypothetical protein
MQGFFMNYLPFLFLQFRTQAEEALKSEGNALVHVPIPGVKPAQYIPASVNHSRHVANLASHNIDNTICPID